MISIAKISKNVCRPFLKLPKYHLAYRNLKKSVFFFSQHKQKPEIKSQMNIDNNQWSDIYNNASPTANNKNKAEYQQNINNSEFPKKVQAQQHLNNNQPPFIQNNKKKSDKKSNLLQNIIAGCIIAAFIYQVGIDLYKNYKQQAKIKAYFEYYLEETVNENMIRNPFTNYQSYRIIEKQFDSLIHNSHPYEVLIIQGPPGIGKSTAIRNLIIERNKNQRNHRWDSDDRTLQIYYISLKGKKRNQETSQQIAQKVRELQLLMTRISQRQYKNKDKNIILIIDEINRICNHTYQDRIKQWRGTLESLKIIGLSYCSQATQFWIDTNAQSLNNKITLKLNKQTQIFNFLKEQLNLHKVTDETLKIIASKYSTFRKLSSQIKQFLGQNKQSYEQYEAKNTQDINSRVLNYFSPKIDPNEFTRLDNTIDEVFTDYNISYGINSQFKNQLDLIFRYLSINEIFSFFKAEYKMLKGENKSFEVNNIQQMQSIAMPFIPISFKRYVKHLRDRLYSINYIFHFNFEDQDLTCAKSQVKRQKMISWVDKEIKQIEKVKTIKKKHAKVENSKQAFENIKFDLISKIFKNKKVLDQIKEWKVDYKSNLKIYNY